jgi:hypothetical protein
MTTRKLTLMSIGIAALATFSGSAMAGGWGFGFGFGGGAVYGYGYGGRYYRPAYFARPYVYRSYVAPAVVYSPPAVVYNNYYPDVVAYDVPAPVTYFGSYCAPAVVYRDCAPRYFARGAYVSRGCYPVYRGYRPSFFSFHGGGHGGGRGYHH